MNFATVSEDYDCVSILVSDGKSVVQEQRTLSLTDKKSRHKISGIPRGVTSVEIMNQQRDPSTFVSHQVLVQPISDDPIEFINQYSDKEVLVVFENKTFEGILLESDNKGFTVKEKEEKIQTISWKNPKLSHVKFNDKTVVPDSFLDEKKQQANLEIVVTTDSKGEESFTFLYVSDISWSVKYEVKVDTDKQVLMLSGYYLIQNNSTKSYKNAHIRVGLSERVQKVNQNSFEPNSTTFALSKKLMSSTKSNEYPAVSYHASHAFSIESPCDLPANSETEISFVTAEIPFHRIYQFDGNLEFHEKEYVEVSEGKKKKLTKLEDCLAFKNTSKTNLPPGVVNLYFVQDSSITSHLYDVNRVNFSGAYLDQYVAIPLRECEKVTGAREKKTFKYDERANKITESISISVVNEMETREVVIKDYFFRAKEWSLSKATPENFEVLEGESALWRFPEVKTGETVEVNYTVTYTWSVGNGASDTFQTVEDVGVFDDDDKAVSRTGGFFSKFIVSSRKK